MSPWPKFYWIMWHLRKNRYVQYPFYTISQLLKDFKLSSDPKEKRYNYEGLKQFGEILFEVSEAAKRQTHGSLFSIFIDCSFIQTNGPFISWYFLNPLL